MSTKAQGKELSGTMPEMEAPSPFPAFPTSISSCPQSPTLLCFSSLKPYSSGSDHAAPELPSLPRIAAMPPAASASAIVADSASGYHHLKIEGYSSLKALPNGRRLSSSPFTVGGHRWRIDCYPNGDRETSAGHVSVFLALDENVAGEVATTFRFSFKAERPWIFFPSNKNNKTTLAPQPSPLGHSFAANSKGIGYPQFVKWEVLEQSRHLERDSFTIRCDVVVVSGYKVRIAEKPAPNAVLVPPSDLNQHLGGLLLSEKGADVVFEAGGETFAAHRCVLAARSPVFSAELFGSMKEGSSDDLVRVDGIEAQVFKALLCFVYTDSLPEMKKEEECTMCQHLLVAADRYSMERLKLICEDKLCRYIDVATVANILALAEAHHCHVLKSACFGFLGCKANLMAVMARDGFEHLRASCPSVVKELFAMHSLTLVQ